jgi:hypothetical protein
MRIDRRAAFAAFLVLSMCCLAFSQAPARAQSQVLLPDQSEAKAKQVLQQAIAALGGDAYLNVQDVTCTGRMTAFDHSGELNGLQDFIAYTKPPDKTRQENLPKRNIINIFDGDKGWELDRGGVSEAPPTDLAQFQQNIHNDIDNILRHRIHEPGMIFRYGGMDIVDMEPVDWVELVDNDNNTIRLAFSRATHLPTRRIVETINPKTQFKSQEIEYFSNFHPIQGIETPFQTTRDRNGLKVYQAFFDKCDYNTGVADSQFTRESLEQRWSQVGGKYKEKKDKYSDNGK